MTAPDRNLVSSPPKGWRGLAHHAREAMSWNRIYRATSYARLALWITPLVAIVVVILITPLIRHLDDALHWRVTALEIEGARALLNTVTTLTLSFIVFTLARCWWRSRWPAGSLPRG